MNKQRFALTILCLFGWLHAADDAELMKKANELAQKFMIIDGHVDIPFRLFRSPDTDISKRTEGGDFDLPRARAGGLDAPFMSIYVSPDFEMKGADEVAERIAAWNETLGGIDRLMLKFDGGNLPEADVLASVQRFADEVMPRL